jgi:hypothetical protein
MISNPTRSAPDRSHMYYNSKRFVTLSRSDCNAIPGVVNRPRDRLRFLQLFDLALEDIEEASGDLWREFEFDLLPLLKTKNRCP